MIAYMEKRWQVLVPENVGFEFQSFHVGLGRSGLTMVFESTIGLERQPQIFELGAD